MPPATAGAIWLAPHAGFTAQAWGLLCLFAATIAGLIARPLPAGALVVIMVTVATVLGLITIQEALSGFANVTVWLIVAAFLFARGFAPDAARRAHRLHDRQRIGGSPLRLGYSIVLADLVMAPMTPSNTARAGGILFPDHPRRRARRSDRSPVPPPHASARS